MAHNIGEMFYYGKRPWHNLGVELAEPASIEEALKSGGLDWEVEMVPLATGEYPPSPAPHRMAVVRKDRPSGHPQRVVGVVHPGFHPLQNRAGAMMFDTLFGKGSRVYHTGGYLKNGEVIWLLAKLPEEVRVGGKDVVETYLLFANSHDGSIAIDIRITTVRVVCNNTLSLALRQGAKDRIFKHSHDGRFDKLGVDAQLFFASALEQARQAGKLFERLAAKPCDDERFKAFLERLLPDPIPPAGVGSNRRLEAAFVTRLHTAQATRRSVLEVHKWGIPERFIPAAEPHWWGALNSVTAWVDHVQEIKGDRLVHRLFGAGDQFKSRALEQVRREVSDGKDAHQTAVSDAQSQ